MTSQTRKDSQIRRRTFWQLALGSRKLSVSDEQIAYFKEHPDEIDELSAPLNIHIIYLFVGVVVGVLAVALAKYLKFSGVLDGYSEQTAELIVDVIFESGVAFVGAGVTAVVLGILLNAQQDNAANWREDIRAKIREGEAN